MARELTPEGRDKLSRLAKERHASGRFGDPRLNGRLGGRPRGGTKRKQRITKRVAEAAEEDKNAQAIIQVFKDSVHPSQPMSTRLKGAQVWAEIARDNQKLEMREDDAEHAQLSREEALHLLEEKLSSGPAAAILRQRLLERVSSEAVIEGVAVDELAGD